MSRLVYKKQPLSGVPYATIDIEEGSTKPVSSGAVYTALSEKQNTLVSGTTIKTVNGQSILGEGDVTITTECDAVIEVEELPSEVSNKIYNVSDGSVYSKDVELLPKSVFDSKVVSIVEVNETTTVTPTQDTRLYVGTDSCIVNLSNSSSNGLMVTVIANNAVQVVFNTVSGTSKTINMVSGTILTLYSCVSGYIYNNYGAVWS